MPSAADRGEPEQAGSVGVGQSSGTLETVQLGAAAAHLATAKQQQDLPPEPGAGSKLCPEACSTHGWLTTESMPPVPQQQGQGSSNSDQATTTTYQVPSPEHTVRQEAGGHAEPVTYPVAARIGAGDKSPLPPAQELRPQHLSGDSVGTQTQAQAGGDLILPMSFLDLGGLACIAESYSSISPLDMLSAPSRVTEVNEALVNRLISEGQQTKREGDALRGNSWRVSSLSKYVEGALKFMQACEYILVMGKSTDQRSDYGSRYNCAACVWGCLAHAPCIHTTHTMHGSSRMTAPGFGV